MLPQHGPGRFVEHADDRRYPAKVFGFGDTHRYQLSGVCNDALVARGHALRGGLRDAASGAMNRGKYELELDGAVLLALAVILGPSARTVYRTGWTITRAAYTRKRSSTLSARHGNSGGGGSVAHWNVSSAGRGHGLLVPAGGNRAVLRKFVRAGVDRQPRGWASLRPFGGLAFIIGWLLLAWRLRRIV